MFPSHTRKLPAAARSLVFACAIALTNLAHAGDGAAVDVRVQLDPYADAVAAMPVVLQISGKAPARCAPSIGQVTLDGNDLNIALQPATTTCAKTLAPFRLRVDAAAGAGLPVPRGQVYRVRVYSMDAGTPTLLAFSLLDTGSANTAPVPENGFWWSEATAETGPAAAGNGASIELQGSQLAVGLFGFAESGAASWSFGSGALKGRVARAPLVQLANGDSTSAAFGSTPTALAGPRLELEFISPTRARAYVVHSDAGRDLDVHALALSRSRFATGPVGNSWSGQWVLVPDDDGAPRVFEFADASSQDAETFHLADAAQGATLDCRLATGTQHPDVCTLSSAAEAVADFDQVGMDRLVGHGSDGARITLMRVPR
jgi:hypothetical protein